MNTHVHTTQDPICFFLFSFSSVSSCFELPVPQHEHLAHVGRCDRRGDVRRRRRSSISTTRYACRLVD